MLVAVSACAGAPKPSDPNVRGLGYVRVDDVLKAHPLYPQLSQIQDAIDALNLRSLGGSAVPRTPVQLARETRELNTELARAQSQANAILAQKQQDYGRREQAAINAALAAAGAGTSGSGTIRQMQGVAANQAQQVTTQANADFQAYQRSVIEQDNTAVAQLSRQYTDRENQAFRQRAVQLQEKESQLGLDLSQADAAKRLDLRMKLGNLALSDSDRKQYRDQLSALDRQEETQVDAQRSADQRTLAAYRTQLTKQTTAQLSAQVQKIHDQTRAKLASRHNEVSQQVAAQLQGLQPAAVPTNLPQQTRDRLAQIDKQFKAQFQADAQKTIAQYQQTRSDLDAQYAALQGANGAALGIAGKQVAQLQRQRDDLYNRMLDQIKQEARKVGAQRGLTVFINIDAAAGGIDLTDDVKKDIESLRQ